MAEKKKTTVTKTTERRAASSPPARTKATEATGAGAGTGTRASAGPGSSNKQLSTYEAAARLFHQRRFREARDLFRQAVDGPERDVAQRAELHVRMCERRLQDAAVAPRTAEEHYTYGVALLNTRNLSGAQEHLERALALAPDSDHVHYALALSKALAGDLNGAHHHLQRAIDLEPRNRLAARQDAEFAPFAGQPPLDALLHPEKRGW